MAGPFDLYQQRSAAPNVVNMPSVRPADFTRGDIGQTLANAGRAVAQIGQQFDRIEEEQRAREEDDARVWTMTQMAQFRADASTLANEAFATAPDGWRGVTDTVSQKLAERREAILNSTPTDSAGRFANQAIGLAIPEILARVAEGETNARRAWRVDTVRGTIDRMGSTLAADPSQWAATEAQQIALINSMTDLTADQKRGLIAGAEETFARTAVAGLVQRDPAGMLRLLRDPEAGGPVSKLDGPQRMTMINAAEAEIERRAARWRAQVADSASAAMQMWELGIPTEAAPSVDTVRSALGEARAIQYEAARATSTQFGGLALKQSDELLGILSSEQPRENVRDAVIHEAQRRAAAAIIQQRAEDPMQFQVRNRIVAQQDLIGAFQKSDWNAVDQIIRSRAVSAEVNGQALGMPAMPLTRFEAQTLGPIVRAMPAQQRAALFQRWSQALGTSEPQRRLMSQLFPASPASAYAGYITPRTGANFNGAQEARLILRGEDILRRVNAEGETGGKAILDMPEENWLRQQWEGTVGNAYEGQADAAQQAYQVYRAYYAGASEASNDLVNPQDGGRARRAVAVATGGIVRWGNRNTVIPLGMTAAEFGARVRGAIGANPALTDRPEDYNLRLSGPGRYFVYNGSVAEKQPNGQPIEIAIGR